MTIGRTFRHLSLLCELAKRRVSTVSIHVCCGTGDDISIEWVIELTVLPRIREDYQLNAAKCCLCWGSKFSTLWWRLAEVVTLYPKPINAIHAAKHYSTYLTSVKTYNVVHVPQSVGKSQCLQCTGIHGVQTVLYGPQGTVTLIFHVASESEYRIGGIFYDR